MKETTTLPLWLVVVLTVVPAVLAGTGAVLGAWLAGARKAAGELDRWRRREETMRMLRWAADKGSSPSDPDRLVALAVLDALDASKPSMLQPEDQGLVDAVVGAAASAGSRSYPGGDEPEVVGGGA